MNKRTNKKGFTMAELMLAIAIIVILGALATVGVFRYLRSMRLLEMDNAAKELYFAAQNRITAELVSGDLGRLKDRTDGDYSDDTIQKLTVDTVDGSKEVDLRVVLFPEVKSKTKTLWDELLPFGSIDDTIRLNGSYVITYSFDIENNLAQIWDVWYTAEWRGANHTFTSDELYILYTTTRGDANKEARKNYGSEKAVIGHYGSAGITLVRKELAVTELKLVNDEVLYLTGKVAVGEETTIPTDVEPQVNIIVEGITSGAIKTLTPTDSGITIEVGGDGSFLFVLDDITQKDKRFSKQFYTGDNGKTFIPGEDIRVTVEVYSNRTLANIDKASAVDNSLFQYVKETDEDIKIKNATEKATEAGIGKVRHLQNLSNAVSNVDLHVKDDNQHPAGLGIDKVLQTADLLWNNETKTGGFVNFKLPNSSDPIGGDIYYNESSKTSSSFYPIDLATILIYEAGYKDASDHTIRHSITNLAVNVPTDAGLFGKVGTDSSVTISHTDNPTHLLTVNNLIMNSPKISSEIDANNSVAKFSAGAVVASGLKPVELNTVTINNAEVTSKNGDAGGAVGFAQNGLTLSTVIVEDPKIEANAGSAGGMVGNFTGTSREVHIKISDESYVTHPIKIGVKDAATDYEPKRFVEGEVAGGLVGTIKKAYPQFENSYSTALVKGTDVAGGLIGSITDSHYGENPNKHGEMLTGYIYGCYVGGHVVNSDSQAKPVIYDSNKFNVTATATTGKAGGFIGTIDATSGSGLEVKACYSTASTKGNQLAGGFVGQATGEDVLHTSISNCYAVGLVGGTISNPESATVPYGAFVGSVPNNFELVNNRYFELINEDKPAVGSKNSSIVVGIPEEAGKTPQIYAAETNLTTYNEFFVYNTDKEMEAYNAKLGNMFQVTRGETVTSIYYLPTVKTLAEGLFGANDPQITLDTHVGDWQPVDTLVFNTAS